MTPDAQKPKPEPLLPPVLVMLLFHALGLAALCFLLYSTVPQFVDIFKGVGMELPVVTQRVIRASRVASDWAYAVPLVLAGFLALDAWIYYLIRRKHGKAWAHVWWSVVFALEIVALAVVVVALFQPFVTMMSQVGRMGQELNPKDFGIELP